MLYSRSGAVIIKMINRKKTVSISGVILISS